MILAYGSYRHALAETAVAIARETTFSPTRVPLTTRETWRIEGILQAASSAELTAAIDALTKAYARQGQDATLYLPDGITPSAHRLLSRDTLGGVRVVRPPSFPEGRGPEYSTFRSYAIELQADFAAAESDDAVLISEEVLNFSGGGPRWVYLPTLTGLPIKQIVQQATPIRVTQTGRAVGFARYPEPAEPLWPEAWHQETSTIARHLPRRNGTQMTETEFEVQWNYQFEAVEMLTVSR